MRPWYGVQHVPFDSEERRFDSATGLRRVQRGTRSERLPECGKAASLAVDEAFMGGDCFRDGGDDGLPVYVVVEFGEEGTPWRLDWRRGGGCDHWQLAHEIGNNGAMI